jgi:CcmD family protein
MGQMVYLFLAFAVIWLGVFVYLMIINRRLTRLKKELRQLEEADRQKNTA